MTIQVAQKNIRQTPRKIRQVVGAVKGMTLQQAIDQLSVMQRKPSLVLLKMIKQGVADATHNHGWAVDTVEIDSIIVEEGPVYKRFRAVSRGRAHSVQKKTSHVRILFKHKDLVASEKEQQAEDELQASKKTKSKKVTPQKKDETKEESAHIVEKEITQTKKSGSVKAKSKKKRKTK